MAEKLATISYVDSLLGSSDTAGHNYFMPRIIQCSSSSSYSALIKKGIICASIVSSNYYVWLPLAQVNDRMYYMAGDSGINSTRNPAYNCLLGLLAANCWIVDSSGIQDGNWFNTYYTTVLKNAFHNNYLIDYITSSILVPLSANEDEDTPIKVTRYDDHVLDPCTDEYYIKSPVLIVKEYGDGREEEEWVELSVLDGDDIQDTESIEESIDSSIGDSSTSNVQQS